MSRRPALVGCGLLVAGLALALYAIIAAPAAQRAAAPDPAQRTAADRAFAPARGAIPRLHAAQRDGRPAPAASLRGTAVDGSLELGPDGRFVATPGAIQLFDYYLSTLGELDLAAIRERIAAEALEGLGAEAAAGAMALYDDYLHYLGAMAEAVESTAGAATPRELLARATEVQREILGDDRAQSLFGDERALAELYLDRHELASEPSLSERERAAAMSALEHSLDRNTRAARARARAPLDVREKVAALRQAGASEAEIWRLRADQFGAEVADRLAELDARRASRSAAAR